MSLKVAYLSLYLWYIEVLTYLALCRAHMDVDGLKEVVCKFVLVLDRADGVGIDNKFGTKLLQNTNNSNVCANTKKKKGRVRKNRC